MNLIKQLSSFGSVPFSHGALLPLLREYKSPNDKIVALVADGTLLRLKKGLYLLGAEHRNAPVSLPLIANLLYGPSCVSLDYALSWHGLIPEAAYLLTSVTPRRAKHFDTPLGRFSYWHVPNTVYGVGMRSEQHGDNSRFLMAGPEQALCDKVLLTRGLHTVSVKGMCDFLFEDLRLAPEALRDFDMRILRQYESSPIKPGVMATLCKAVEKYR